VNEEDELKYYALPRDSEGLEKFISGNLAQQHVKENQESSKHKIPELLAEMDEFVE